MISLQDNHGLLTASPSWAANAVFALRQRHTVYPRINAATTRRGNAGITRSLWTTAGFDALVQRGSFAIEGLIEIRMKSHVQPVH